MTSIWGNSLSGIDQGPLQQDLQTQVLIIGAGMAGILLADSLRQRGVPVVLVDAGLPASGQTCRTTAKITAQHGALYSTLEETLGAQQAAQYAAANRQAVERYAQLVRQRGISCGLVRCPAFLYSVADAGAMQREAAAQQRAGLGARFTTGTELPFPVAGAVEVKGQARFHPLQFLTALAQPLTIYSHSRVLRVEGCCAQLENGRTITARQIVFACHYPFVNAPGFYFARMHQERSYVLALQGAMQPRGMYLGVDPENGWSLRTAGEFLLFGGAGHRTGENRAGGRYDALLQKARELWPGCTPAARWSAQDCMTLDGMPYIGIFAPSQPNWYVATGFGKWGMTGSMVAATLLTARLTGEDYPYADIFSPQRFFPSASISAFWEGAGYAVRGIGRRLFVPAQTAAVDIARGHGGIVAWQGKKYGVYRHTDGTLFAVDIRCPHRGCELTWNDDEKSWDCPCHGSRFDFRGQLLDGPAQRSILLDGPVTPE